MQPAPQRPTVPSRDSAAPKSVTSLPVTPLPAGREGQPAVAPDKIVALFGEPAEPASDPGRAREAAAEPDWSATIERVRRVAAQARQTDERAKEVARSAQAYMRHANQKVGEAETRAQAGEAAARAAQERTQQAEQASRLHEERANAAEARAQDAEARVKRLIQELEAAENRTESAEALARSAEARTQTAETQAAQAKQRSQMLEAQAHAAEARATSAQTWAKRLWATVEEEFCRADEGRPQEG